MKKITVLCVIFSLAFVLFAQNSSIAANYRTAQRCLQLSEKYILNGDFKNALTQSEMGISYDDSISDLYYVKAVAQNHLDFKRCDILDTISLGFVKNNWINYNENNGRILYADILSETGRYEESLAIIDGSPMIYSSDAEFIRIKNYYRMGGEENLAQARKRFATVRKIYPSDQRFPYIFFLFEKMLILEAENNDFRNNSDSSDRLELPVIISSNPATSKDNTVIKNIADFYIAKIPDYTNPETDMEISALMFADGEQQQRLLKAVGEKNQDSQLFALIALKAGIISEDRAYNLFFENRTEFDLRELINFVCQLQDEDVIQLTRDYMNAFSGTLHVDGDLDLIPELTVKYERGRPAYISYDADNDEINELYSVCDFGVPLNVNFTSSKIDLFYDIYPSVKKISNNNNQMIFNFLDDDYNYTPFNIQVEPHLSWFNIDFFIPYIVHGSVFYDQNKILQHTSSVEVLVKDRNSAKAIYTYFGGHPVFVNFMERNYNYAFCSMENGLPYKRFVDYDRDGIFETVETYYLSENSDSTKIFGDIPDCSHLELKVLQIDRNGDTVYEYEEEYLGENGIISSWDNDSNSLWDYQYIRYPDSYGENGQIIEETVFYEETGIGYIVLKNVDSIPVSLKYYDEEMAVVKGSAEGIFWLEKAADPVVEQEIISQCLNKFGHKLINGVVSVYTVGEERYSLIKIDSKIYCRLLPETYSEESDE